MAGNRQIIESIQRMTGTQLADTVRILLATVDSVDEAKRTCNVTTVSGQGSFTIENVQLMPSVDDGLFLIPQIGTTVIVVYSVYNQPFIALFSGLKKIVITAGENNAAISVTGDGLLLEIGETTVQIADDEIKFNDGALGGLVKVAELTTKLNNLENKVNTLITTFNTHVHTGVTTGPGSSATTPTTVNGTLTPTQQKDIENEKIKQG